MNSPTPKSLQLFQRVQGSPGESKSSKAVKEKKNCAHPSGQNLMYIMLKRMCINYVQFVSVTQLIDYSCLSGVTWIKNRNCYGKCRYTDGFALIHTMLKFVQIKIEKSLNDGQNNHNGQAIDWPLTQM